MVDNTKDAGSWLVTEYKIRVRHDNEENPPTEMVESFADELFENYDMVEVQECKPLFSKIDERKI